MSHHQSRADRSDSQQRRGVRHSGVTAHQRTSAGKGSGGGGQGPSTSAASLLSSAAQHVPVPSSNQSVGINGQTRQHWSNNFEVPDSHRAQPSTVASQHGMPVGHGQPGINSSNGILPRSSRPATSSSSSISIEVAPVNSKADTSWNTSVHPQLSFQFGSIGASIGQGPGPYLQIPARTSSAPPNLDEQKQDLLRFEASSAQAVKVPIPTGGQVPRSQVEQSGGQQPYHPMFRPQVQQSAAGSQPSYNQQSQQQPMHAHVTQRGSHLQASAIGSTQGQLQTQAHVIPSQPQQQSMLHIPYQHGLQSQLHHGGAQVMKYPPSMGGSPLMGPTLAPLPGPMHASQMSQMSHQLSGGLGSGIPGQPYGVVPVPSAVIPTRTSIPVKITHPDTHEELKFGYKSTKRDISFDGGTAAPQSGIVGNGTSQIRTPVAYGSGAHLSTHQNVYAAQPNGPYSVMQHYYQPSPPLEITSKNALGPEPSVTNKMPPVPSTTAAISKEVVPGNSIPGVADSSDSVPQVAINVASEKQELPPAISCLGTSDPSHVSTADVDDKSVKERAAEIATVVTKDSLVPGKEVKEEVTELICAKDTHRPDSMIESRQHSKKKKKKDGLLRASSGDVSKVSRVVEIKKESDGKILEPQKAKLGISKGISPTWVGTMPEAAEVLPSSEPPQSSNSEWATSNQIAVSDASSLNSEIEHLRAKEVGMLEEVPLIVSFLDIEAPANSVDKALADELDLSSDKHVEKPGDIVSVQVDSQRSVYMSEDLSIDPSSKLAHVPQAVEGPMVSESLASCVQATEEVIKGSCNGREVDICGLIEAEITQDDSVNPELDLEPESLSPIKVCTEVGDLQSQLESIELHLNVQDLSVTPTEAVNDSVVSTAPDVKQGSKKKKLKDILAKADAAGSGDLYNAYKAPEQKNTDETVCTKIDDTKSSDSRSARQVVTSDGSAVLREVDDWEDAVELASPKGPENSDGKIGDREFLEAKSGETYTRDFLLTFKEQNLDLPLDFEVRADIVELLLSPQAVSAWYVEHDSLSGRPDWQPNGGPRSNSSNTFDDERWARVSQGLHSSIWPEGYTDISPAGGLRPGNVQGLIPRMPSNNRPGIMMPPLAPGLIPGRGLMPGGGPGLFKTNTIESERWQRMPTGQKGLIPSPQTSLPPVHKAERRYEVGTTSNEEESKQRQIKAILNKLTPQNFQKLFEQVKDVNIQSAITLTGVISQIFDKALTEPTFCEMYAMFCKRLATDMPEFIEDDNKVTFKRVLLNKCQEEFHRGEREQAEALVEAEGNEIVSTEEREVRRLNAKRRMLGNIRFIGELFKNHMLTERIMHECIRKLLGDYENPEEEDVEALCKLISTIGYMIDQPTTKEHIDAYLERIARLSNNQKLSARIRFMLKDLIDLRRNGWQERRKVEGPKRIEEVHRDAVQERQATVAQAGRLSRGPSTGISSGRRLAPPDSSTRGPPSLFSPTTPLGAVSSARGVQTQGRGALVQDVRMEDKLLMERSMPMPLSQRLADDGPLTLGPQGGLGRGLSLRGQPSGPGFPTAGEIRRLGPVSMAAYSSTSPLGPERPVTPPEKPLLDESTTASGNSSRSLHHLERTLSDKAPAVGNLHFQHQVLGIRPSTAPAYVPLTEEQLIKKSEAALLEYFSAHDPKEAAQCVEDLKAPNFYPMMVSIWVSLSFEKKGPDRELLAELLISLQKSETSLLKTEQIMQGFQAVLDSLEDCIIDTPMAPDYIAKLLVRLISAQALSLDQVGDLLKKSEVLQRQFLLEILGKVLAGLREDRGERLLIEMFQSSRLRFENFFATSKPGSKSLNEFLSEHSLQCLGPEPDNGLSISTFQQVGAQLLEQFRRNEPIEGTLVWLEEKSDLRTQSESRFLQMLMTQVLTHLVPAGSCEKDHRDEVLKEQLGHYRTLLRNFATDKEQQRQYIIAMQLYVHDIGHPAGLMTSLFSTLYHEEVISESAFYKWQDDVNDPTLGRDRALRDVYKWLHWLKTAPEQIQDDEC